jgi:hypothetical protein
MTTPQPPLQIDFIAYHHLQAQTGESVFDALSRRHICRWLIGPNQKPTGADAAVLLDHRGFQPELGKTPGGYRYLFHLSHDLGDLIVYLTEYLQDFDIVFVPTKLHKAVASRALPESKIIVGGWPKYDRMQIPAEQNALRIQIARFQHPFTVLYAPTYANTWEWLAILPPLFDLPVNVIVKNHIYVNPGQAFPKGQEEAYRESLQSAGEMENSALVLNNPNVIVAPRTLNICSLFPYVNMLISDSSSCTLEFLPFGDVAVETGAGDSESTWQNTNPHSSKITPEIRFVPLVQLRQILAGSGQFQEFLNSHRNRKPAEPFITFDPGKPAGEFISSCICDYLKDIRING